MSEYHKIDRAAYARWKSPVERRRHILKMFCNGEATREELIEAEEAEIKYELDLFDQRRRERLARTWPHRLWRWLGRMWRGATAWVVQREEGDDELRH